VSVGRVTEHRHVRSINPGQDVGYGRLARRIYGCVDDGPVLGRARGEEHHEAVTRQHGRSRGRALGVHHRAPHVALRIESKVQISVLGLRTAKPQLASLAGGAAGGGV
jgi:hypothetical protein